MEQRKILNVGGESFVLNAPSTILGGDDKGVLGTIIEETIRWEEDETIFFDRDPTFFQYILNYFHDASLPEDELMSPADMKSIRREAEYYGLQGLSIFMSNLIKGRNIEPVHPKVAHHLRSYLGGLQKELQKIHDGMSSLWRISKKKERTAMIQRISQLVKLGIPERNLFNGFVGQPTLPPTCLPFLRELIGMCGFWGVTHSIDDGAVTPVYDSTGHLENELAAPWNTMRQRHPPSAVLYETPKFKLQNVKEEEYKKSECGCYLFIEWNRPS